MRKLLVVVTFVAMFVASLPVQAAESVWVEEAKLVASDAGPSDWAGKAVAIDGKTIVVGAPFGGLGAAHVYSWGRAGWEQVAELVGSDTASGDRFGESVAIDGETIVVGAPFDDDTGTWSGSAYVFRRTRSGWTQDAKLTSPKAGAGDGFGASVSVEDATIVVGSPFDDRGGVDAGAGYVFSRSRGGWDPTAVLNPSGASEDASWGGAVAIDGDRIVIGPWFSFLNTERDTDPAAVYVFTRHRGSWDETARLSGSDTVTGDTFGSAVAIDRDRIVVGARLSDAVDTNAGSAYVFSWSVSGWEETAKLLATDAEAYDRFGWSVAVDGDRAVVGAPTWDQWPSSAHGAAYVFDLSLAAPVQEALLTASDLAPGDWLGWSVGVSGDTVVAGVPLDDDVADRAGSARVFIESD